MKVSVSLWLIYEVGVPVLTSNTSSLPEIVGNSGILIDPNSIESIFQGLLKY